MTYPDCYHDAGKANLDSCKFSNDSVNVVQITPCGLAAGVILYLINQFSRDEKRHSTIGMTVFGRYRLFSFNLFDQLLHGLGLVSSRSLLGNFLLFCC